MLENRANPEKLGPQGPEDGSVIQVSLEEFSLQGLDETSCSQKQSNGCFLDAGSKGVRGRGGLLGRVGFPGLKGDKGNRGFSGPKGKTSKTL